MEEAAVVEVEVVQVEEEGQVGVLVVVCLSEAS